MKSMNHLPPKCRGLDGTEESREDAVKLDAERGLEKSKDTIKMSRQRLGASSRIISAPSPNTSTPLLKHTPLTLKKVKHPSSRYLFSPLRTIIKPPETPSSSWSMDSALENYEGKLLASGQKSLSNEFALLSFDDLTATPLSVERQTIDMLYGDSKPGAKLSVVPETYDVEHNEKHCIQNIEINRVGVKEANYLKSSFPIKFCLEDEFISENEQDTTFEGFDTRSNSSTTEFHSSQSMMHLFEQDSFELYKEISTELFSGYEERQDRNDELRPNNMEFHPNKDLATMIPRTKPSIDHHSRLDEYKSIGENVAEIFREKKPLKEENDDSIPSISNINSNECSENRLLYLLSSEDIVSSSSFHNQNDSRTSELYHDQILLNPNDEISFRTYEGDENKPNVSSLRSHPVNFKLLQLGSNDQKIPQIFRKRGYSTSTGEASSIATSNKFNIYTDIMDHLDSKVDDRANRKSNIYEDSTPVKKIQMNKNKKIQPSAGVKVTDTTPNRIPLSRISLTSPKMNSKITSSGHKSARKKLSSKISSKTDKTMDDSSHLLNAKFSSLKENF